MRRRHPLCNQTFRESNQALIFLGIGHKQFCDDSRLVGIQAYSYWITRSGWINAVAIGRTGPRQQVSCEILLSPSSTHAFGDQGPFIFGHGTTDLQQQLVMRILAHRVIDKLNAAPALFQLFEQQHLMDIIAR